VLEKAFDKKFEDIFISFNPEPLGIGAVAQVRYFYIHLSPSMMLYNSTECVFVNPFHI
jgi:hypothetical protein